jgi:hypothetical protein
MVKHDSSPALGGSLNFGRMTILRYQVAIGAVAEDPNGIRSPHELRILGPTILANRRMNFGHSIQDAR